MNRLARYPVSFIHFGEIRPMQPIATIQAGNVLGECILWDGNSQSVWWTDIDGRLLQRFDWRAKVLHHVSLPERLAAFGFVEGSPLLVGAFESGFALFDPETGERTAFMRPDGLTAGMRLNDGRVDCQGRFWAGAMVEDPATPERAQLYCLEGGVVQTRERGLTISNGICWSPDGAWFYVADSAQRIIWRYSFNAQSGTISAAEEFARASGRGTPDGAIVDAEGYLWSAQWGGGCVIRYAPDGRIDRVLEVPATQPTCVAFGGPDLNLLFVTTARSGLPLESLAAQTGAGDVFVYDMPIKGLAENRFKPGASL